MVCTCKGICNRYPFRKGRPSKSKIYSEGGKRCSKCEIYLDWNGVWCPCCGVRLRYTPHRRDLKVIPIRM